MDKEIIKDLIKKAISASKKSYSPYSNYKVGAALLTDSGKIFTGTNIENASYGSTICAERVAILKAVSEGFKKFKAITLFTKDGGFPCGNCLQVLSEFSDNEFVVVISKGENDYKSYKFSDLFPNPFTLKND